MRSFRDPGLRDTKRLDDTDFDLAMRIVQAGEQRDALVTALNGATKSAVRLACDWICSSTPQNASIAMAAAIAANAPGAQKSVADFVDLRRGQYSRELVRQAERILGGR